MRTDRPESLADRQLADAWRDPHLVHGREAVVADWWAAMGAAERVRTLADWGLQELLDSEAHEERPLTPWVIRAQPAGGWPLRRRVSVPNWLAPSETISSLSTTL